MSQYEDAVIELEKVERRRLLKVAHEYEAAGYDVQIEPGPAQLPSRLANFRPDLIARRGKEVVVVDVKSKANLKDPSLQKLARVVQNIRGWSYELVVTNPRPSKLPKDIVTNSWSWIERKLVEGRKAASSMSHDTAFLILWTALEGALRHESEKQGSPVEEFSTLRMIKQCYANGVINKSALDSLMKYTTVRNRLVHGLKANVPPEFVAELTDIVRNLRRSD